MTVILFLAVLAVLVFVHELGHFLAAKGAGARVDAFAIGFGPKIVSWQRGETLYSINIVPFGGYVKIFGENPDDESLTGPAAGRSFANKRRYVQAWILAAGVIFNFLFAWALYAGLFASSVPVATDDFQAYSGRMSNQRIVITAVEAGSPAERAGLKAGDTIMTVRSAENGNATPSHTLPPRRDEVSSSASGGVDTCRRLDGSIWGSGVTIQGIQNAINCSAGAPITIDYVRGGQSFSADIVPKTGIVEDKYAIGIAMGSVADLKLPIWSAIYESARYTASLLKLTVSGLFGFIGGLIHGTAGLSAVSGPVGIAGIVGDAAALGWRYLVMITALISINLGVVNLIPFPALDGGRILFVAIESVIRRRIPPAWSNAVNAVGFALLIILMLVVTWNDVAKLLG